MSGSGISTPAIPQRLGVWHNFIVPFIVMRGDSMLTLAAGAVKG